MPSPEVSAPSPAPAAAPEVEATGEADAIAEVAGEVCGEVFGLVRTLAPLQAAWMTLGVAPLGGALMTAARWRYEGETDAKQALRDRWPELVPGHAAMGCLVGLMVDGICRRGRAW